MSESAKPLTVFDLGRRPYLPVLRQQEELVERRKRNEIHDTLLLVEHEPVYTLGRRGKEDNIVASSEELRRMGVEVAKTERGGDVTFHGPGQLVGYPIIDLGGFNEGAIWYVDRLEETIILALAEYGIEGRRDAKHRGVWIGDDKIAAIGVRITRRVTMHGFSLNVRVNLDYYRGIVPCGIADKGVTSLHLLAPDVAFEQAKAVTVEKFKKVFGYK